MDELTFSVESLSQLHLNALFLLGLILFIGAMGARFFQKLRIPQVIGYIVAGIILGRSGLNIIDKDIVVVLNPFNYFALGLIGFMIGGELKKDVLRRYGKQFIAILLSEGLFAFFCVFLLVGVVGSLLFGNPTHYWMLALLLGSIASATAPAATTDVLWEYKSRGPLTTTLLGIVALDDGLSLILFALASSIASSVLGSHASSWMTIARPFYEIVVGIGIGFVISFMLIKILRHYAEKDKILVFSLCALLLALGLALILEVDMLLSAMTMGIVLVNKEKRLNTEIFKLVSGFATPFYILFFVLVGAKFDLRNTTITALGIAVLYLLGRTVGKMTGAYLGAKLSGSPKSVTMYMPYCLFSQAGVAIGLSILASQIFPGPIGNSIIVIIALSTFVVQLVGPPCVKYAIVKAQEVGLNVTEEDVLRKMTIADIIDKNPSYIYDNMSLNEVLLVYSNSNYRNFPVVDKDKKLKGVITSESIRRSLGYYNDAGEVVIAHDVMEPVKPITVSLNATLFEAQEIISKYGVPYISMVDKDFKLTGFIEKEAIEKLVATKLIEAEQKASSMG